MNIDNFLKEYNGHRFADDGAYCSADFKSFSRKFKNYLKRNLPDGCRIINHNCGHYYVSGFIKKEEQYVYYSYSWDRFNSFDIKKECVLIRAAKNEKDYTGGINHYTSISALPKYIQNMLGIDLYIMKN